MAKEILEKMEDLQDKEITQVVAEKAAEEIKSEQFEVIETASAEGEDLIDEEADRARNVSKYYFHILGGGYLIFMSYKLITGFAEADKSGAKLPILVGAIVLFALVGALFIYNGVRNIWDKKN